MLLGEWSVARRGSGCVGSKLGRVVKLHQKHSEPEL